MQVNFFSASFLVIFIFANNIAYSNFILDEQFGINGIVITNFGTGSGKFNREVPSIHVKSLPDGKIIVIGDVYRDYFDFKDPGSHVVLTKI